MRWGIQVERPSRSAVRLLVVALIIAAIAVAGSLIHPAYVILRAGPVFNTLGAEQNRPLVQISGLPTYPTTGSLDFTTVAQYGGPGYPVDVWDVLGAKLDPEAEIVPREQLYPSDVTPEQVKQEGAADMTGSQDAASAVALHALGKPEKAKVAQVVDGSPAAAAMKVGDIITAVSGTPVTSAGQVSRLVQQAPDPAKIAFRLDRGGTSVDAVVASKQIQGRRIVGIGIEAVFAPSISVKIDAGDVGGPSAGMMFALAVYDKLTPGPLTAGQSIAGTGTIALDGSVGPIGGIRHKMVGAREAGAAWFLAPVADCAEVGGHVPDGLHVAAVATFDQARAAVEKIAAGQGASLAGCPG